MKKKRKILSLLIVALVGAAVIAVGAFYVISVRESLWMRAVTQTLEVTAQGRHTLDTYLEKDSETVHILADRLLNMDSTDSGEIAKALQMREEHISYVCVDFTDRNVYSSLAGDPVKATDEELQPLTRLKGKGIREPYIDSYSGLRKIAVYETFVFKNGNRGLVQKVQDLEYVSERFALSFYDDSGFSYVVDRAGKVLMRTLHRNSNRTFVNLFDIIDSAGNDKKVTESFRDSLQGGKQGVADFRYNGEEYVFCYVPMQTTAWYVVAIIPNAAIMTQVNDIVVRTLVLCAVILVGLLLIGYCFYRQLRNHHHETEALAYYDSLTGLYRYKKFIIEGEKVVAGSGECTVIYLDIIGFKLLNDTDGYQFGDDVLKFIAVLIKSRLSENEIACREAGDDFIMLINGYQKADVITLCRGLAEEAVKRDSRLKLRFGVCRQADGDTDNISGLIDRARIAQRKGTENGEIIMQFYNQEMRANLLHAAALEQEMGAALQKGEFVYFVQPKFSTSERKLMGGEALVRWQKGDGSFVSPGEFVPLFERNGFIRQLDEFVYASVCKDLGTRLRAGAAVVPISVNVSRVSLTGDNFIERYRRIKDENGIPDGLLELELTESSMLEDTEKIFAIFRSMRKYGFRCSIDDFGSGYSSLNALKDLPADVLKLDRKFLEKGDDNEKMETIVRSVIGMAKQLSMLTVAEGVETNAQLSFIRGTGCDMVQGFIFSRPLPKEEFYQLLAASEPPDEAGAN